MQVDTTSLRHKSNVTSGRLPSLNFAGGRLTEEQHALCVSARWKHGFGGDFGLWKMSLAFSARARYKSAMHRASFRTTIFRAWSVMTLLGGVGFQAGAAAPLNDNFVNAIVLTGFTNVTATNVGATAEAGEPAHAGEPAAKSLWWKWTPPFAGSFSIVTSNSYITNRVQLDTTLAVYKGASLTNLEKVASNDDTYYGEFGAIWSRLVFRAYPTETLMIAVDSLGAAGSIQMRISIAGPLAYPWSSTNLEGQLIYSSNFLGQVVLVDFWKTTCGACIEELPDVIRVQTALGPRGFTFVGLSGDTGDDPVGLVNYYLRSYPVNYPIAMMNPSVPYLLTGGPIGYPTKVLIDREGRIVGQYLGGHDEAFYRDIAEPLLRTAPPVRLGILPFQGGNVRLTWPGSEPGYHVETTMNPAGGSWTDPGYSAALLDGQHAVIVPVTPASQFFRLSKP